MAGEHSPERDSIERAIEQLEEAWRAEGQADLAQFVPPADHADRRRVLVHLIQVDQEHQWERGSRKMLEDYLADWPELREDLDSLTEALRAECWLRKQLGSTVSPAELQARFPAIAPQIQPEPEPGPECLPQRGSGHSTAPLPGSGSVSDPPFSMLPYHRFRALQSHAAGGLGKISVATDEELHREVALKELLEPYSSDRDCRMRFVVEAEITGSLEHPGVVPVYGLGRYRDGRPFYAMRLIRGESLREAVTRFHQGGENPFGPDGRSLELCRLLRHFLQVCHTIHYAHSRGVIHRDLKPANIMLGKYGETMVVDWGVAKIIGRQEAVKSDERTLHPVSGSDSTPTLMGQVVGTPAFMSPEQIEGQLDELGPASDVYSLGATLYYLLTERMPYEKTSIEEIRVMLRAMGCRRPRSINPRIPVGLEAICLKAMALRPADRYATAADLADDIERWLADQAVTARPDSTMARLMRWSRHHRSWAAALVALMLGISIVSAAALMMVNRARREAVDLAEHNRVLAVSEEKSRQEAQRLFVTAMEAVDTGLTGTGVGLEKFPGMQVARKQLLLQAANSYEKFAAMTSSRLDLEIERGRAHLRLGDVHRLLGDAAAEESADLRARSLFERLVRDYPTEAICRIDLANARTKLGLLWKDRGRLEQADAEYLQAIDDLMALEKEASGEPRWHEALGTCLTDRGALLVLTGQRSEAEKALDKAHYIFEGLIVEHPKEPHYRILLATAHCLRGKLFCDQGKLVKADTATACAQEALEAILSPDNGNLQYLEKGAVIATLQAHISWELGRYDDGIDYYRRAIGVAQILAEMFPEVARYSENLAIAQTNYAQRLYHVGDRRESKKVLIAAQAVWDGLVTGRPGEPGYEEGRATCRDLLGRVLDELGEGKEAFEACCDAVAVFTRLADRSPKGLECRSRLAIAQSHVGRIHHRAGRHPEARKAFQNAIDGLQSVINADSQQPVYRRAMADACRYQGDLLLEEGEAAAAKPAYHEARRLWSELSENDRDREAACRLAWLLSDCADPGVRDPQRADQLAREATAKAPKNAGYHAVRGAALYRDGKYSDAIECLKEAIRRRRVPDCRHEFFLALARWHTGQLEEAKKTYQDAVDTMEKQCPGDLDAQRLKKEVSAVIASVKPAPARPSGKPSPKPARSAK